MPRALTGASNVVNTERRHNQGFNHKSSQSFMEEIKRQSVAGGNLNKDEPKVYTKTAFFECASLPAVRKLNRGRFDDVTLRDVEDLFVVLDGNGNKVLEFSEVGDFLMEVLEPPCSKDEVDFLWEFIKEEGKTTISADELFTGLTAGPMKTLLKSKQQEHKIKQKAIKARSTNTQVDRELLTDRISWRVSRDDAFATLPLSMLMIVVFITLVTQHLHIQDRRQVANGIESWIHGYGAQLTGPFLQAYVADINGMWDWMAQSGIPAIFGECWEQTETGEPLCRLASRNWLLGDARLVQLRADGSEESRWLLHSERAEAYLESQPGDYLGAVQAEVAALRSERWADEDTDELILKFSSWNSRLYLFAITEVKGLFDLTGRVTPLAISAPVVVDPYDQVWLFGLDAVYAILLLYPMLQEIKDIIKSCQGNGCIDGLHTYFGLWNGVDWLNITMGLVSTAIWVISCMAMAAPALQNLLSKEGAQGLIPGIMALDVADLEKVEADLSWVKELFFYLHVTMGINAISIVAKFFKAFQANPRLRLVTDTMVRAAEDIAHFSIVLTAVFLAFAVLGHIFFGGDLVQFSSFGRSINTAFVVLMGEFEWYVIVTDASVGLGSGMPRFVLILWFWLYMVFVLLILLNMLLAIVLEHYTVLVEEIRTQSDAGDVWSQARNYMKRARDTKGFIPLTDLERLLLDKHAPAHPEIKVTHESLVKAFPNMKNHQAEWLMEWLAKEAAMRMMEGEEDEQLILLKELEALVESIADEQKVIGLTVTSCSEKLGKIRAAENTEGGGGGGGGRDSNHMKARNEILQFALAPPTRGHLAMQLAAQAEAIKELSRTASDLTTRLDTMAPKMQPLPIALKEMTQDVASIKSRLDRLASTPPNLNHGAGSFAPHRTEERHGSYGQPRRAVQREVPLCFQSESIGRH